MNSKHFLIIGISLVSFLGLACAYSLKTPSQEKIFHIEAKKDPLIEPLFEDTQ